MTRSWKRAVVVDVVAVGMTRSWKRAVVVDVVAVGLTRSWKRAVVVDVVDVVAVGLTPQIMSTRGVSVNHTCESSS